MAHNTTQMSQLSSCTSRECKHQLHILFFIPVSTVIFQTTTINTALFFLFVLILSFWILRVACYCYCNGDNMRGSEGELLVAVRQPVVTLSVKDLPSRGKKRASRQPFTRRLPDEAFSGLMRAVLQESKCDTCYNSFS